MHVESVDVPSFELPSPFYHFTDMRGFISWFTESHTNLWYSTDSSKEKEVQVFPKEAMREKISDV